MKQKLEKKTFRFPSTAALLLAVALLFTLLSHVIPAGSYERTIDAVTGRTVVVPDSFQYVESTPVSIFQWLKSSFQGVQEASDLVALMLICGGALGVVIETGAIHAGIGFLAKKFGTRKNLLITVLMIAFAICSTTLGMAEEFIVFMPTIIMIAKSLGYDPLTGVAILLFGIYGASGFSLTAPYTIIIAQQLADVPILSGMGLRAVGCVLCVAVSIWYTLRYAKKVANDPSKSLLWDRQKKCYILDDNEVNRRVVDLEAYEFTTQRKVVLAMLGVTILFLSWGIMTYGWYAAELCGIFMALALVSGIYYYKSLDKTINTFMAQAGTMAQAAILLALSRAIIVVLTEGQIIDTIVHTLSIPLQKLSGVMAAWAIHFTCLIINFFVPSSSGQAMIMMPILTPLSDLIELDRQVMVHAYSTADNFGNLIIPTHPTTLACLGIAGISYNKWFRLALPLVSMWCAISLAIVAIGTVFGWPY